MDRWLNNQPQPYLVARIRMNASFGCWKNGVIVQDRPREVLWWMSIKETCKPKVLVTTRLSKGGCISLAVGQKPFRVIRKLDWSRCGPPSTWETYSSKMGLSKILNLEHKYGTTKAQLLRKANGAQSSIKKRSIPPKDMSSWSWHLIKGPWKNSHNPGPIMSPHTYIYVLSKPAKRN